MLIGQSRDSILDSEKVDVGYQATQYLLVNGIVKFEYQRASKGDNKPLYHLSIEIAEENRAIIEVPIDTAGGLTMIYLDLNDIKLHTSEDKQ